MTFFKIAWWLFGCLVIWLFGCLVDPNLHRHPLSLNRHLDSFAFLFRQSEPFANIIHDSDRIVLSIWVAEENKGGEGDDIDGVCNHGLKMHEIDKVHRANLQAVSAAIFHCRSCVARRGP